MRRTDAPPKICTQVHIFVALRGIYFPQSASLKNTGCIFQSLINKSVLLYLHTVYMRIYAAGGSDGQGVPHHDRTRYCIIHGYVI